MLIKIKSAINRFFFIPDDTPAPKSPFQAMWFVWLLVVNSIFNKIFTGKILTMEAASIMLIVCGMAPSIWSFYNKRYVEHKLKKYCKNLTWYLFRLNLIWMAAYVIGEILGQWPLLFGNISSYEDDSLYGSVTLPYLAGQSEFFVFWLLSIPLVLVYHPWRWGMWVTAIGLIIAGYHFFLKWYASNWDTISFGSLCLTIGVVLVSAVVSYKVSQYNIKRLFYQEKTE